MKDNLKRKQRGFWVMLLLILLAGAGGCAKEEGENPFDFSEIEPKDLNPWTYVKDTSISASGPLTDLAASSSELGITVGIIGTVFSIFYMVIRICFTRNAAAKEEVKREALLKGMIAIMLFSIPFWLELFKQFADLLV